MALAETANLVVKLSLGGNFASQIGKATAGLGKLEKGSSRAYKAGAQIGTGIRNAGKLAAVGIGLLTTQVAFGLDSLVKLEQAQAQTNAVLKSTGQAAGISGAEVTRLAEKYEALNAIVGDEFIRAGQNMLLTFTKIKGKAFEPALEAILNINTAMGKGPEGLTKTAVQVGKALNDPVKGLTALTRIGVTFSAKQQKRIKDLVEENDIYGAQRVILRELKKEFGGSFAAQGNTTAGSVAKFGDAIEDLQRSLATALLPTVRNVADALTEFLADPEVVKGAKDLGTTIAGVFTKDKIKGGIALLGSVVKTIRGAMPAIVGAAQAIGSVVGTAVNLFNTLPTELKTLLVAGVGINKLTGGLVTNLAGGLISAVLSSFKGVMSVNAGIVNVSGAVAGVPGAGGGAVPGKGGGIVGTVVKGAGLLAGAGIAAEIGPELNGFGRDLRRQIVGENFPTISLSDLEWPFGPKNTPTILPELGGNGLLGGTPSATQPQAKTPEAIKEASRTDSRATLQVEQAAKRGLAQVVAANAKVNTAVESMKSRLATELVGTTNAERETKREAARGAAFGAQGITATQSGAARVASAIAANRPIITVNVSATTVTRVVNVTQRYGSPNGSRSKASIAREFG